ncbi:recombinase family protein [Geomonas subterranea]|uniref:Recombinase family protein n=1 Tax=Geomonas subterranea TaxID=2847989 RepID=A0ABX8LHW8_9BACT|nr:recombinase family protein [Geomonas subterranea]QXE91640.1 recombinase family protein [Geomonas subterranea]QXM10268.1 recombinase family protein [Geomonas subterranea]
MKGQVIGYRRVSSLEQNTARQLEGLELDEVFEDKVSGKDRERPELERMIRHARKGDKVVVHSMDRMARNLEDLLAIVRELTEKGVSVEFIKEKQVFDGSDDPFKKLMLQLLGSFAEFERALIKSRQREGIELKKAAGGYKGKGRKKSITDEMVTKIKERVAAGEKKTKIAADFGISRESIYKLLKA